MKITQHHEQQQWDRNEEEHEDARNVLSHHCHLCCSYTLMRKSGDDQVLNTQQLCFQV